VKYNSADKHSFLLEKKINSFFTGELSEYGFALNIDAHFSWPSVMG
jgi:hypothetical protein